MYSLVLEIATVISIAITVSFIMWLAEGRKKDFKKYRTFVIALFVITLICLFGGLNPKNLFK